MMQLAISSVQTAARSFWLLSFKDIVPSQTSMCVHLKGVSDLQENLDEVNLCRQADGDEALLAAWSDS